MKLQTTRFGEIEVEDEKLIYFPDGLIGFEECKQYFALYKEEKSSVWWLQSVDRPEVAFILTDPLNFLPNYEPVLSGDDMKILQSEDPHELEFNVILVVPDDPKSMTANLLGPIIINTSKRVGIQAVLRDNRYSAKHPVSQAATAEQSKGGGSHAYS